MSNPPATTTPSRAAHLLVPVLYALLFGALFLQYPLGGGLPGNADSWLGLALTNGYLNHIASWLTGHDPGAFFHPDPHPYAYGEPAAGVAALLALFRVLGFGNLWAYYLFITAVFALTAWAVWRLATTYVDDPWFAAAAGFFFTCSNFAFAHIDDALIVFFCLPALALYHARRFLAGAPPRHLVWAGLAGGAQVYFSVYVFCFQTLALAVLLAVHARALHRRSAWRAVASGALVYVALSAPCLAWYLYAARVLRVVDPAMQLSQSWMVRNSLDLRALVAALPENLLYGARLAPTGPPDVAWWTTLRRHAFLGFLLAALAAIGLLRGQRGGRTELALIAAAGLLLAVGPVVRLGGAEVRAPLGWLAALSPEAAFLRVPLRAWFLTSLALALLASQGLAALVRLLPRARSPPRAALLCGALALHAAENLPVPLRVYATHGHEEIAPAYRDYFAGRRGHVLVDVPSSTGLSARDVVRDRMGLWGYSRQLVYMNWQAVHRQRIFGGAHGFLPPTRWRLALHEVRLPDDAALDAYVALGLEYVVFHPRLVFPGEDGLAAALDASPRLRAVVRTPDVVIYEVGRD